MNWPSTTTVLASTGCYAEYDKLSQAVRDKAMRRGRRVTLGCHHLARGLQIEAAWRERHQEEDAYLDGYRKFLREHKVQLIYAEKEFRNEELRLVSHPDQIVGGLLHETSKWSAYLYCNLEIKTGTYPEFVKYQTAGQVLAIGSPEMPRFCLLLTPGTYKLVRHTDWRDIDQFKTWLREWWTANEEN